MTVQDDLLQAVQPTSGESRSRPAHTPRLTPRISTMESMEKSINDEEQGLLGHHKHGLTVLTCAVFMVGEMAGSGVLALPDALERWIGILVIILCCIISAYTGHILGRCWSLVQERYPEMRGPQRYPYPAIGQLTFGTPGRLTISIAINFTLFGVSVVFLLLASQNMHLIFKQHIGHVDLSFCYWLLIVGGVLLPCSWPGTPKDFWPVAVGATTATSLACIILVITMGVDAKDAPPLVHREVDLLSFATAFGTICFAFGGHPTFPTFQTDMREPDKFGRSCLFAYLVVLLMYLPVATTGYWVYGRDVAENVLTSVKAGVPLLIVEILITGHLVCSFIIVINPLCQEIEEIIGIERNFSWKRVVVRSVVCVLVLFVAESIPHFGAILSLIGGSSTTLLAYIAPPVFYLKLAAMEGDWRPFTVSLFEKVLNAEIMIVGLLAGIAATYSAIRDLASPDTFTPPCYINITAASG
ncbi:hypothetical protein BaRGS_00029865 [Batillaria attramentaria]|uniref:Amino acid transporter transmembrane domain-containing protein n=1 Tax=Batillaria attramentaria TaxID=370345 RepID=A0ABD0JVY0_9CAEN